MVARINCIFGQLAYLAKLRNSHWGGSGQAAVSWPVGEQGSHEIVQEAHRQVFMQWLTLSLEEQFQDFEQFMDSAEDSGVADQIRQTFSEREGRSTLVPVAALPVERSLFEADLAEVLRLSFGAALATK